MRDYRGAAWARKVFENWRLQPKWQCPESYERRAQMIGRHWDGIATCCDPRNRVSRWFVRVRPGVWQHDPCHPERACGLHDEEYLKLKVVT